MATNAALIAMPRLSTSQYTSIALGICLLLLQACSSAPEQDAAAETPEPVPEITLNLPKTDCACIEEKQDYPRTSPSSIMESP